MQRLTEKDDLGNWCLKGVRWEQLREGQVITKEVKGCMVRCASLGTMKIQAVSRTFGRELCKSNDTFGRSDRRA